ncbi:hypothetical protein COL01_04940 [Bacillus thuringiensis]|uniref:Uncharacterized protein n=1 Tax=Bacillus thuringiensis TaxID=1428 RepID=A0A9X6WPI2_BACTU|nr:hypothetical protein [Bacillus thuringiensis]PFJ40644.1 hypothetical protein COJ15_09775 [Bacillus thuringiensis]PFN58350.1 hypothetical protein COJ75_17360 [Bacillus thuringiensis]PFV36658.1 hypothetical protein COL01_04940 [Bacillus thuringiensis]
MSSFEFASGYFTGKAMYKNKNKPAFNKPYINKEARKVGLKVGFKALGGIGLLEDAWTFGKGAYDGYRKAYKEYDKKHGYTKKSYKKKRRR